jgi:type IV secretory pathway VirB4 component
MRFNNTIQDHYIKTENGKFIAVIKQNGLKAESIETDTKEGAEKLLRGMITRYKMFPLK